MLPLFPPWSNGLFRACALLLFGAIVGAPLLVWIYMRTPIITKEGVQLAQPVMFDHRHHARDDGIDCQYCHFTVTRSTYASVPPTETCMGCHSQIWPESPLLEKVRASYYEDRPLVWTRVHRLPDHVRFDHGSHVSKGVPCTSCHGEVDLMPAVYPVHPLQMRWCIDCHRDPEKTIGLSLDVHPSIDCTTCHM